MNRRLLNSVWLFVSALTLALYAANLFLGEVNQDEGWYLYAARLVAEGQLPYLDFAFTQGPVMAYVYAMAWPAVQQWGIAAGRVFTITLGTAGILCAALLAFRLVDSGRGGQKDADGRSRVAALLAAALVGVNVYQSYFTTVVKTYALAALLLTAACLALTYLARRRSWPAAIAGVLMALSAATRSSIAVALPLVFVALLYQDWRAVRCSTREMPLRRSWLWFGIGAGLTGLLVFVPYIMKAPGSFWFCLFEYHTGRQAGSGLTGVVHKAGFISRVVRAYFVGCGLGVGIAVSRIIASSGEQRPTIKVHRVEPVLWAAVVLVTLLHIAAPFPYDDYQVALYPLFAALIAAATVRACRAGSLPVLALVVALLCAASSFSSPRNQGWFVAGRDRMWWPLRERAALSNVQRAGRMLREAAGGAGELLTSDAYLAIESGLRLPHGLEMGPFSYFPEMSRDDAIERHVLNREMLAELLATNRASVAALSGWSFAVSLPAVTPVPQAERKALLKIIDKRYELFVQAGVVGQADTELTILKLRASQETD